ncbi:MAG: transposase [Undibacterium sp.]|nr:transposase [Opitutaceae bacterium]
MPPSAPDPLQSRDPHLQRLAQVWLKNPVYFITTCTHSRRRVLATDHVHQLLRAEWLDAGARHGWQIGRYVIMPDHVHFFCSAGVTAKPLSVFLQRWKEWSAKAVLPALAVPPPLWQHRFLDHLLRTSESHAEKWLYVRENPVRAGLVSRAEDWPYAGHVHFDEP